MEFTHFNKDGRPKMVDVSEKAMTAREAVAEGSVYMKVETLRLIRDGSLKKGDVLGTAQIAGITGAKKTSDLIPMCHNIFISGVDMDFELIEAEGENGNKYGKVNITATARTSGQTGIEMEAMTAVSTAALTVYDMCKAVDRGMEITAIRLIRKSGGKSGLWQRK